MGRTVNADDATGKVRIVVHLVGTRHRPIKGNRMRVMTVPNVRVSDIANIITLALEHAKANGGKL
jgi:hypothetical protein